jgi:hypothetical protein
MPEMKGRTLEELNEMFAARVPTRKFPQYQCAMHEEIVRDVNAQKGGGEVFEIEDVRSSK